MSRRPKISFKKLCLAIPLAVWTAVAGGQVVANFSGTPVSGCAPLLVQFKDLSTGNPIAWNWDFGTGQLSTARNPMINFPQPGTYTIRLIVRDSSGNIDDEIKTDYITVFPSPQALFKADLTTACAPATVHFTDESTSPPGGVITGWSWNFGDGTTSNLQNPTHSYSSTGFYTVSLQVTSNTGCKNTITLGRYIRVVSGINVDFTYSQPSTCQPPFLVNFQQQASGPGILSYSWNLGNGTTSTSPSPSAVYSAPGTYSVKLDVVSNLGCTGTITAGVIVSGKTTDFTFPSTICVGQTVSFQNNSSPAPAAATWTFGDGTTSSQTNPVKTFLSGGSYQVKLVNNYGNCIDSVTKTVNVITSPTVAFSSTDSTSCNAPFTVNFTDQSPGAATWFWDFGDGTTSTQQNPSHTYTAQGFYDVTLSVTLPGGCGNTITKTQYVKIKPITVTITNAPAGGCAPFTFSPVASIQSIDSIVSYSWDLGEPGAVYTTQSPTHTYNSTGNYNIQLTVATQDGCTQTVSIPNGVTVGTKPTANFSFAPNNTCASTPIQFTDLSTTTPGAAVKWTWDFGDGATSNSQNPSHVFKDTGNVVVSLTVQNNGCPDIISKTVKVLPPVANFGYKVNCANRVNVTFTDSSLANAVYGPITYHWDFGDGQTSAAKSPAHTYAALGTYMVILAVTNGPCSYSDTQSVKLTNEPADFTINKNPVCKNQSFTLSAINSNPANVKNNGYTWVIGPTTFLNGSRSISHSFSNYGTYNVSLTVTDSNGCTNMKTVANYIKVSGPTAKFSSGPGGCLNKQVTFNDLSTAATAPITQWTWNFGDGTIQSFTSPPFSHTYSQTGNFNVSLTVKDSANCADNTLATSVLVTNPVAGFKADTFYCPSAPLRFVDTSTGLALKYNWDFGDGGSSALQNPTHSYAPGSNSYTIKLTITDTVGCQDSVTKSKYVTIGSPTAAFDIVDSSGICLPLVTSFTFKGTGYKTFLWDFGDGTTTTALNPTHFYNLYGSYNSKLFVFGPGGCVDSAVAVVNAYDPAVRTHITQSALVACNSLSEDFTIDAPPGFKYTLYFGDGTSDTTDQPSLTHLYASPGNYSPYMILQDKFDCEPAVNATPIHVYGALPLFGKNKKAFCDTGTVSFTNFTLSNDPVTSTTWDFGDGATSTAPAPTHFFGAPGTYAVRLIVTTQQGCTSIFSDTVRVYRTPVVSISGKDTICINAAETFNGLLSAPDSTIQWLWNLANGTTSQAASPIVSFSSAGTYLLQLTAKNKLGCSDTASHSVVVVPLPTAVPVSNPLVIISGASTQLNMNYTGPVISYNWLPVQNLSCTTCPQPTANPKVTTDYHVVIEDRYGCENSGDIVVKVICSGQNFFIPNTFSPNGDGVNDIFYVRGTGLFRVNSLMVFDRWGEVVFENRNFQVNDPSAGWNGTFKGQKAKADVYVYQIELICDNGEIVKYAGNVALIQ